jgi:hypothetical protein
VISSVKLRNGRLRKRRNKNLLVLLAMQLAYCAAQSIDSGHLGPIRVSYRNAVPRFQGSLRPRAVHTAHSVAVFFQIGFSKRRAGILSPRTPNQSADSPRPARNSAAAGTPAPRAALVPSASTPQALETFAGIRGRRLRLGRVAMDRDLARFLKRDLACAGFLRAAHEAGDGGCGEGQAPGHVTSPPSPRLRK